MMGCLLKWAEDHGGNNVTMEGIQQLINFLDEDPIVVNHLLWAFLNVNLTGRAREIFCNVQDSQGFEAWRRVHRHIYSTTERRQDELYHAIHNPKRAGTPPRRSQGFWRSGTPTSASSRSWAACRSGRTSLRTSS